MLNVLRKLTTSLIVDTKLVRYITYMYVPATVNNNTDLMLSMNR